MSRLDDVRKWLRCRKGGVDPHIFTTQCSTQDCSERADQNLEADGAVEKPLR